MDPTWNVGTFAGTERLRPIAFLGRGGSGLVYRVLDRESGLEVALKTIETRDPEKLYRLKQEFRVLAGIHHPNLVELYELIVSLQDCFFTMELIEGLDFVDFVRTPQKEPTADTRLQRFLHAARQLVDGLAFLHSKGKLHRDVKPSNTLVDLAGRAVLLDFGLATALGLNGPADTESGAVVGTFAYMAPEQAYGRPSGPAADWYSAGVMFYEALTGRLPFQGPGAHVFLQKRASAPPAVRTLVADIPEALDHLVLALLEPDPSARPGRDAILASLERCGPRSHGVPVTISGRADDLPFVGRAVEMMTLRQALDRVAAGHPIVVHVRGPSGIGKTELVRRFLASVEANTGTVVLRARCHVTEVVPYNAFDGIVDSLSRWLIPLSESAAAALVPLRPSALLQVFPVLGRVPAFAAWRSGTQKGEPQEVRRQGFRALRELLARVAARWRLVLWIDDVQWSDEDSAALVREVFHPQDPPQVMLVLSYRNEKGDDVVVPFSGALQTGGGAAGITTIEMQLGPLAAETTRELTVLLCGEQPEIDVGSIAQESAGSPFLLGQLVSYSLSAASERGRDGARVPVLGGLAAVVEARLARLSGPGRRLLEVVSVAGRPVDASVALDASAGGPAARRQLMRLEREHLLRSTPAAGGVTVDIYHERIREVIVTGLPPNDLRERHRSLAGALRERPDTDPRALFRHLIGAGDRSEARQWAMEAAERAEGTFAFLEAADLYARTLELLDEDDVRRAELLVCRAAALVNAGRGAEAAPLFVSAVGHVSASESLDLRRRAAEQFLVTGHMDEGTSLMRELCVTTGIRYPRSTGGALVSTIAHLSRISLHGITTGERAPRNPSPFEAARIDTSHSAAKGLALVDPLRGLYFAVVSLSLALRAGDRERLARELASVGASLLPAGGTMGRLGGRMVVRAREMAEAIRSPYLHGFTAIAAAQKSMVEARWREMLDLCDSGVEVLKEQCRGVTWELDIGRMAALRALEELGEIQEMARRAALLRREAEDNGDLYALVTALLTEGASRLAADDCPGARDLARRAMNLWTPSGFHLQHFYALRLEAYCDLYERRPLDAWRRLEQAWPGVQRSSLLRHAVLRTDAHLLRARVALAVASAGKDRAMLRHARRSASRLDRERRPDAVAHALLVRAGAAAAGGEKSTAISLLHQATAHYAAVGMKLCIALARWRAGELLGKADLKRLADSFLTQQAVGDPQRFLCAYAPGFA